MSLGNNGDPLLSKFSLSIDFGGLRLRVLILLLKGG